MGWGCCGQVADCHSSACGGGSCCVKSDEICIVACHAYFEVFPPPPSPASPPHASYYTVSGAGSGEWNGQYVYDGDGPLIYRSLTCATCALYAWASTWRLAIYGSDLYYVATHETGEAGPPLKAAEWSVAEGAEPTPTLVDPRETPPVLALERHV